MPTYQYVCTECGEPLEAVQKFSDDALTECPACTGKLRKVFSAAGIIFKGSGFYRTDSRGSGSSSSTAASAGSTAKDSKDSAAPAKSESSSTASSGSSDSASSGASAGSAKSSSEKVA
ncbi:FmdB family transcriptional regulator [Actinomadura sp. PM05-2]|uniref:FmdB family transcriptional regulator n=1 Tax=Actinomadura parmotrematis TaxID=2864039 RepID=A0ABS7FMV3_9ACTN|nr:FmdB family transcriptional regulator [Actinomadura parmotrematis]